MERLRISLAAARVNSGLSQRDAAKILKTSVRTIQNHEQGRTEPSWAMAEKYSALYRIPLDNIFFGSKLALSEKEPKDSINSV